MTPPGASEAQRRNPGRYADTAPDTSAPRWTHRQDVDGWYDRFPWWGVLMALILGWMLYLIIDDAGYNTAWDRIIPGVRLTIETTIWAFIIASGLGLIAGLGRSITLDHRTNPIVRFVKIVLRNLARLYVEFIRGIPILVLIFTVNFVVIPEFTELVFGSRTTISPKWRAIIALALIYGGYIAEIFRAGIQAVDRGQVEASRSLGLTRWQTTTSIVLPQALRAVIPPLGNDFIAVLKDTSLLSVLGVLELTQLGRQYASSSFKFRDTYLVLSFIYLSLTVVLSLFLGWVERRLSRHTEGAR